ATQADQGFAVAVEFLGAQIDFNGFVKYLAAQIPAGNAALAVVTNPRKKHACYPNKTSRWSAKIPRWNKQKWSWKKRRASLRFHPNTNRNSRRTCPTNCVHRST